MFNNSIIITSQVAYFDLTAFVANIRDDIVAAVVAETVESSMAGALAGEDNLNAAMPEPIAAPNIDIGHNAGYYSV